MDETLRGLIYRSKERLREPMNGMKGSRRCEYLYRMLKVTIDSELSDFRRFPTGSVALVAAYEIAKEEDALAVWDGLWTAAEVHGGFSAVRCEMSPANDDG